MRVNAGGAGHFYGGAEKLLRPGGFPERMQGAREGHLRQHLSAGFLALRETRVGFHEGREGGLDLPALEQDFPESPIHIGQIDRIAELRIDRVRLAVGFLRFGESALLAQRVGAAAERVGLREIIVGGGEEAAGVRVEFLRLGEFPPYPGRAA